jgi:hypothetical protein
LEKQVDSILKQIAIDEEIYRIMLKTIKADQDVDHLTHMESLEYWQRQEKIIENKKKDLLDLYLNGKITEIEHEKKRNELEFDLTEAENSLKELKNAANTWLEQQKTFATTLFQAHLVFSKGTASDKKEILHAVGSNFSLIGGNVSWDWVKPFDIMAGKTTGKTTCPTWRAVRDLIRTLLFGLKSEVLGLRNVMDGFLMVRRLNLMNVASLY